jgi:hypothetical protein
VLQGRIIDLGALIIETAGLELDPYPRKPGEVFEDQKPEPIAKISPFARLKNPK